MITDLSLWMQLVLTAFLFYFIMKSSEFIVDAASDIAKRLGVSELLVGLTVVAFGTSAPEFAVTGMASLKGASGIALGNVVGSNIFNVGIILALVAIVSPIQISKELFFRDSIFLLLSSVLLTFFCVTDATVSQVEGAIFLFLLLFYLFILFKKSRADRRSQSLRWTSADFVNAGMAKALGKLIIGLLLLLLSSRVIVDIAIDIARDFNVSEWLIGTTLIAAGTSLPELATAIMSLVKKRADIGIGNIVGSEIFNVFGVIGLAALVSPVEQITELTPIYLLLTMTFALKIFMRTGWQISRTEGVLLMLFAFFRWGITF